MKRKQIAQASPFIYKLVFEVFQGKPVLTEDRYDLFAEFKKSYTLRDQFSKEGMTLAKNDLNEIYIKPSCSVGLYVFTAFCLAENKLKMMRALKAGAQSVFSEENERWFKKARAELKKLEW